MFAALLVQLPALVGFTMNFLIQIGAGVMWRLIKKISFLLHLLHWCAKKHFGWILLFCHSEARKDTNVSAAARRLYFKMVQQLLVFHFVCPSTSENRSKLFAGILGKALHGREDPTCSCYHSVYHFTQDATVMCVCIRVCVSMLSGAIGISRKWQNWWSGTTQRRREIAGLNQQTVTVCAYVCEWEWENEWDNVHKNPLVPLAFAVSALSRDRTSHVRFHYGCQFLLHSLNAAFGATAGSFCSNWVRVSLQWLFFLSIFFFYSHSFQQLGKSSDALRGIRRLDLQWDHLVTTHWCLQHELFGKINTLF